MSNKKLLIANNKEVIQDNYNHYYQSYTGYPLVVENNKLCTDHPSYITEIYGNTTQDVTNLTDIRSVGVLQEDGTYKVDIIESCNLFDNTTCPSVSIYVYVSILEFKGTNSSVQGTYLSVNPNTTYCITKKAGYYFRVATSTDIPKIGDKPSQAINNAKGTEIVITTGENDNYLFINYFSYGNGDSYDDKQELFNSIRVFSQVQTQSIYLPQPLRSIGDYSDRLYWDNTLGKYCIEKNIADIPAGYAQVLDDTLVLSSSQIIETSITNKVSLGTYPNCMKVTTDELDVAPSNISGQFAEKEAIE